MKISDCDPIFYDIPDTTKYSHLRTERGFIYTATKNGQETSSTFVTFIQDGRYINVIKDGVFH